MTPGELVLGVPAAHARRVLGGAAGLVAATDADLARLLDPAALAFRDRAAAETDESFRQLIPYVVLRHGDALFHYRRGGSGGEARLHALRSVGVGGHVNPPDAGGGDPYRAGLLRELAEEVETAPVVAERLVGFIADDATPVGRVHLGVVHLFTLAEARAVPREASLTEWGFAGLAELRASAGEFESWSRLVLEGLID